MKASRALRVLTVLMLLPLLSGCFTEIISHEAVGTKSDWFSPTALYKSKADGNLAVEGTLIKAGEQNGNVAYLIIPQKVLVAAHLQTKGDVAFKDISSLPPQERNKLYLRKKLNSDYEKITSVPNQGSIAVNQRTTVNIQIAKWLPFAFIFDTVTFPLEIYFGKKMGEGLSNLQ
jgi:uncharacterized protein YceK